MATSPAPVNEGSDCTLTATYVDIYGKPYTPMAVAYQIDDLTNDVNILPLTQLPTTAGPGNSYTDTIDIPGSLNGLQDQSHSQELRQITYRVTAPGGAVRYDTIDYSIINIEALT